MMIWLKESDIVITITLNHTHTNSSLYRLMESVVNALTPTLLLSESEQQDDKTIGEEIAAQEKNTLQALSDLLFALAANQHLEPIIRKALMQKGYSGNALDSKVSRVAHLEHQKSIVLKKTL